MVKKKVTWGELKRKIDEQVKDDDIINHIILVSSELGEWTVDDIEIWGSSNYGKAIQNINRGLPRGYTDK
jgi:hypothetical protein